MRANGRGSRVWSGARGDHRQRSAGRRTRKNARARRNDRISRAIPARQERARAGALLGPPRAPQLSERRWRDVWRPAWRRASAGATRSLVPGPRDSTGFARAERGWRLTTSRLTLSKRRLRLCAGSALGRDRRATPRCSAAPWFSRRPWLLYDALAHPRSIHPEGRWA